VTRWLIGINVTIFVVTIFYPSFSLILALNPLYPTLMGFLGQAFNHANLMHLLFNMFALYQVGFLLERLYGSRQFLLLYVVLWLATAILILFCGGPSYYLGASGIVMGLFGFLYGMEGLSEYFKQQIAGLLLINILIGFLPGVSLIGHFGGAAVGYFLARLRLFNLVWR